MQLVLIILILLLLFGGGYGYSHYGYMGAGIPGIFFIILVLYLLGIF
jgi:hypothetical protein